MTEERLEELMVKAVDAMATVAERSELMAHLVDHPELRAELDAHLALKATTDGWVERLAIDVAEDRMRGSALSRLETGVGLALFGGGVSVLTGFGLVELMLDAAAPLWAKIGTAALVAGLGILLTSVVRRRLATRSADRYSEVIR